MRFGGDFQGAISLKNPWPTFEHLPVSLRYHPQIVLVAALEYLVALLCWCLYCYRHRQWIVVHHRLLTAMLSVQTLDMAVYWISYIVYNGHGRSGDFDLVLYQVIGSGFEVTGFFFLLIVSMGYIVYRPGLELKQMKVAAMSIVMYGVICSMGALCFEFEEYCHFIDLFQFILRCFLLVGIVALLNALISSVHTVIRQKPWEPQLEKAYLLLKAHKTLRWAFYAYVIGPISVHIVYMSIFHWTEEWLYKMINANIIEPALICIICYHFRPSPHFAHVEGVF